MPHQESEKSSLDANGSPASSPTTPTENTDTRDERLRAPQQQQSNEELPVPLGGTRAWLQVVGGFFAFINIWGFPLSFGVFQNFYALSYLPDKSVSSIAWIGTVQNFLVSMVSVLSGPVYDLGYYRTLVLSGTFLNVLGIMMLSLSSQYYELFLSHVCNGVGSGLLYVPTLAFVVQGHGRTRSLAMGIVAAGIALGGIVYTIIFLRLQPTIGFPWTLRTMGFLALLLYLIAIPLLIFGPSNLKPSKARALYDFSALRSAPWIAYTCAQFTSFWGYLIPMFYVPTYAQLSLQAPASTGDWLLVAVQAASLVGRMVAASVAHYTGVLLPLSTCIFVSGILSLAWLGIHSLGGFAVYCTLYGLFSGALIALPPSIFPSVCPRTEVQGTWMGMAWGITSLASLTGAPIAGSFVDLTTGRLTGAQIWSGVVLLAAAGLWCGVWFFVGRREKRWTV